MGRILSPSNGASKLSAPSIPHRQLSVSIKNYSRNPEYINNYTLTIAMHCRHLSIWTGGWPTAFIVSSSPNSYNEFVIRGLNAGFRF